MRNLRIVFFLALIIELLIFVPLLKAQEDFTLFNEAMELRIQREWDKALQRYESLKQKYPDSKYVDDAEFWSAYILEEQGKESDAFAAYQTMKQKHPDSPWSDDATIHQIGLAEKFVKQGQDSYRGFLTNELESPYKNVKYQAALSLGKLGDERAIPVLKEMSNNGDKDMRSVGNSILQKFDQPRPRQDRPQLKPIPITPPKRRTDKKEDTIKKQSRIEPQKQSQPPARKPNVKINRPTPKQQPQRSTPPKTSSSKKRRE